MARKKTTRKNLRSTPAFDEPWSRNEAILQNILGANNTLVDPQSRIEAILQAILYGTAYTDEPQSRMEELLLCILNGETTDMEPISRNEAILIAKINGDSYTEEPQSRIEELLIAWLNAFIEKTVTGNPITVNDAVAQNVMALLAELVPAQDLHGYSNPWPAGGGKNKFGPNTDVLSGWFLDSDNVIRAGTGWELSDYIEVLSDTEYTFNPNTTAGNSARSWFYDADRNAISYIESGPKTFTTPLNCAYMRFSYRSTSTNIQLELGSQATAYAPYANICPISGHTGVTVTREGKNIFDEANADWINGKYLTALGQISDNQAYRYTSNYTPVEPSTQYAFSYNKTSTPSTALTVCEYDEDKNFIQRQAPIASTTATGTLSGTMTTTATTKYIRFSISRLYSADIQIEKGNAATTYQPYSAPATVTLNFGQTIYGGTVDFTTGKVTVDRGIYIADGTVNKATDLRQVISTSPYTHIRGKYYVQLVDLPNIPIDSRSICSHFKWYLYEDRLNTTPDSIFYATTDRKVYWVSNSYTTLEEFNQYLVDQNTAGTPVTLVYPLVTPTEITLTPQTLAMLAGTNILQSAEADDLSLTYKATN